MERREDPVPRPSDDMLVNTYLRTRIAGGSVPGCGRGIVHEADVYSDYPYELVRRYAPAHGAGDGDDTSIWYFFSPARYASGSKRWRKVGADGRGVWHTEGRAKDVKGSAAGATLQKLTYKEKTASAIVKPGWLMTEYAVSQEHGHGRLVLCKIYRSPRGPGSETPLRAAKALSAGCKRKAKDVVVEHLEAPPTSEFRPWQRRAYEDDDNMFTKSSLESELPCDREGMTGCEAAAPECQWREQVAGQEQQQMAQDAGDTSALTRLREFMERDDDETLVQPPPDFDDMGYLFGDTSVLTRLKEFMESDDDETLVQLPPDFDNVGYLLGGDDDQPGAGVPPCAAQPGGTAFSCVQMSQQDQPTEDDVTIGFTFEELMGSSVPSKCSGTPANPLIDNDVFRSWMTTPALCAV